MAAQAPPVLVGVDRVVAAVDARLALMAAAVTTWHGFWKEARSGMAAAAAAGSTASVVGRTWLPMGRSVGKRSG